MKIPSQLERIGVQTKEDADLLCKEYPEWCVLSYKDKIKLAGETEPPRIGILPYILLIFAIIMFVTIVANT